MPSLKAESSSREPEDRPRPSLLLLHRRSATSPRKEREGDGLGTLRGVVYALILEGIVVLLGFGGWELWRLMR